MTQFVYILFLPILIGILLSLNLLLAPNTGSTDAEKLSPYECGIQTLSGQTRAPFSISFWLVAVLFLLFDIDLALLYPLSLTLDFSCGSTSYAYTIGIVFLGLLTAGFAYEWGKGAIKFTTTNK